MSKKYSMFITILFCTFIFGFGIAHVLLPDRTFSEQENDWLAHFVTDNCEVGPGMTAKSGEVYQAYRTYCADTGEFFRSTAEFYAALDTAGYTRSRTNKGVIVHGLKLKNRDCAAFDDFLN